MITKKGRRLRIGLGREAAVDPSSAPGDGVGEGPALPPQIEFVAYADDCLLSGWVRMAEDRLTDLLNEHDEYQLEDVYVEKLADGGGLQVKTIAVRRDELLMVHAIGPRGDRGRRRRTLQHPIALQIGPFQVRGYVHGLPGSDPLASFRRRQPMVPLTEAWIEYAVGDIRQRRRVDTLVVNRDLVDWVTEAIDEEVEFPDVPLSSYPQGPLLKDFTGSLKRD